MEYQELLKRIGLAVNSHDPIGLLGMGAPGDEYDAAITAIAVALRRCTSEEDCLARVWTIFRKAFDEAAGQIDMYRPLVRDLMAIRWEKP